MKENTVEVRVNIHGAEIALEQRLSVGNPLFIAGDFRTAALDIIEGLELILAEHFGDVRKNKII